MPDKNQNPSQADLHRQIESLQNELASCREEVRQTEIRNEQYRHVLDCSSDIIFRMNLQTYQYEYLNTAIFDITGYTRDELYEMGYEGTLARMHPEDVPVYLAKLAAEMNTPSKKPDLPRFDYRWKCKNGQYKWFGSSYAFIHDEQGHGLALIAIVRDITPLKEREQQRKNQQELLEQAVQEHTLQLNKRNAQLKNEIQKRKTIEASLEDERNLLQAIIESIPDHIYVKDTESRFVLGNKRLVTQTGLKFLADLIGKTDYDFIRKELADKYFNQEREIVRTGKPVINEEQIGRNADGEDIWVLSSKIPLIDRKGQIIGIVGSNRDITKYKILEHEIHAYQEKILMAEQISQLGLLSATMTHELNQPLTVIQLLLQDSLAELEKNHPDKNLVENLKDSLDEVTEAHNIITRYRNILRTQQDSANLPIDLNAVATRIVQALGKLAENYKTTIIIEGLDALPKFHGKIQDFEQVFFILIHNALQAANKKSRIRSGSAPKWNRIKSPSISPTTAAASHPNMKTKFSTCFSPPSPTTWGQGWVCASPDESFETTAGN